jgi:hypothetical protein
LEQSFFDSDEEAKNNGDSENPKKNYMKNFLRKLRLTKIDKKDKNLTETEKAMMNYMRIYKKK